MISMNNCGPEHYGFIVYRITGIVGHSNTCPDTTKPTNQKKEPFTSEFVLNKKKWYFSCIRAYNSVYSYLYQFQSSLRYFLAHWPLHVFVPLTILLALCLERYTMFQLTFWDLLQHCLCLMLILLKIKELL